MPQLNDQKTKPAIPVKINYYTASRMKVADFCLGFFGVLLVLVVLFSLPSLPWLGGSDMISIISIVVMLFCIVQAFRKGRKFIAIGIISIILIPILVLGSCLVF